MSAESLPRSFGPYTLLKLLARGGMGEIYLARSTGLAGFQKYYAIKKLLSKFVEDNDVTARFMDEAKLGARLCHPNIVQCYDLGRIGKELYMAAEFVDGFDLRRILRFCHEKKRRIPLDVALFTVREVLSGLSYAHKQVDAEGRKINLVHRDISPQNVLVSFEGEVKIIDFGLAKSTQRSQETQANVLLGNFGYMSPEQARGRRLDERTDVYSAGIVMFELLTATKRFVDENPLCLLEKVAHPAPVMPSERAPNIPKEVDALYAQAVHPERDKRIQNAADFRDQVTRLLHKINPRATREHLSVFLEHLFLGGPAPAANVVEDDPMNKSVALAVKDIVGQTEAFTAPKESDTSDRSLAEFDDNAVQTSSHPLMRNARLGDRLEAAALLEDDLGRIEQAIAELSLAPPAAPAASSEAPSNDPANRPPVPMSLDELAEDEDPIALDDEPTQVAAAPEAAMEMEPTQASASAVEIGVVEVAPPPELPAEEIVAPLPPLSPAEAKPIGPPAVEEPSVEDLPEIDDIELIEETPLDDELDVPVVGDILDALAAEEQPAGFISKGAPIALTPAMQKPAAPAPSAPPVEVREAAPPPPPQAPPPVPPVPPPMTPAPATAAPVAALDELELPEIEIDLEESSPGRPVPEPPSPFKPQPMYESLVIDFDDVEGAPTLGPPVAETAPAPGVRVTKQKRPESAGAPPQVPPPPVPPPPAPSRTPSSPAITPPPGIRPAAPVQPAAASPASVRPAMPVRPSKPTGPGAVRAVRRQEHAVIKRDETSGQEDPET